MFPDFGRDRKQDWLTLVTLWRMSGSTIRMLTHSLRPGTAERMPVKVIVDNVNQQSLQKRRCA
jgi:hypothetical protein